MKLVSRFCPECGKNIEINEELEKGFCNYCGAEILNKKSTNAKGESSNNKEVEIARKLYNANEPYEALKRLKRLLKRDPFNYDALKLYLIIENHCSTNTKISYMEQELNRFKSVKKAGDDALIKRSEEIVKMSYKYHRGTILMIIGVIGILVTICLLLITL